LPEDNRTTIRVLERAIDIIQAFSFDNKELSLAQICEITGLPKTTAYRILVTLERHNFVIRNSAIDKYRLGYEIIRIGSIAQKSNTLEDIAREMMEQVSVETKQTCNLYIRDGMERVCVAQVTGSQYVWYYSHLGAKHPLYCGAGKLILAYMDDDFVDEFFRTTELMQLTQNTITDEAVLRKELVKIRKDGYSVTRGERNEISGMAAVPIFDYTGKNIAALTISGPIYSFTEENVRFFLQQLHKAAKKISLKMGARGSDGL